MLRNHLIAAIVAAVISFAPSAIAQDDTPIGPLAVSEPVVAGMLTITQAWTRATPPGAATGAGYLTIANSGGTSDRLLSVASPAAGLGEIHEMTMVDDRMMMRPVPDGLVIPAGETVVLEPGGLHFMFAELGAGFVEGSVVTVSLTFDIAGVVEIDLIVYPIGSGGPTAGTVEMEGMAMDGLDSAGADR